MKREHRKPWSIQELAFSGLFSALIAVGAFVKITIPVQPVPMHFTLQFFFVLLSALILGAKGSLASVCTYLVIGLCGVPVFATGGGPAYLLKPTFGFLIGFAAAGFLTGLVYEKIGKRNFPALLLACTVGLLADYACGMIYFYVCSNYILGVSVGWKLVFINCFLLTVGEDFVLCVLAAFLARRLLPAVDSMRGAKSR
ncbi:MAG: biotin transporter BioY [Lachnospiraceae bacterium]|nr:biotin transporter BioY [Lachnospiraceae bacterium]